MNYKQHGKKICNNYYEKAYQFGISHKASKLVIASNLLPHLNGEMDSYFINNQEELKINQSALAYSSILNNFSQHLKIYHEKKIDIYYVSSIPFGSEFNPNKMFDRSFSLNPYIVKIRDFDLTSFYNKYGKILNDLKSVASNHQATIIDPIQTLCSKNSCKTVDANGIPIYCDDNHFTKKHVSSSINYLDFIFI